MKTDQINLVKPLVKALLERPIGRDWSVQGLGMMRTYLTPNIRLHIWDRRLRVENVSEIHNHPWDFTSRVIVGMVDNVRYIEYPKYGPFGTVAKKVTIKCGEGAYVMGEPERVLLEQRKVETYREGQTYMQYAHEIHRSAPADGTVTLCMRQPKADPDHAAVYWFGEGDWVDATPRQATEQEIGATIHEALTRWDWD